MSPPRLIAISRMKATARGRRSPEARREVYPQHRGNLRGAGQPGGGRLFQRSVRFAEMDRGHQEEARRTHPTAAGSETVRDLRVRRRRLALAVPAAEPKCGE